jgi:hypothetical protein
MSMLKLIVRGLAFVGLCALILLLGWLHSKSTC